MGDIHQQASFYIFQGVGEGAAGMIVGDVQDS
jgi:hypothetical protein